MPLDLQQVFPKHRHPRARGDPVNNVSRSDSK